MGGEDRNSDAVGLTRHQHIALAFVAIGALAIRCVYLWGQVRNNPMFDSLSMDALVHHQWAQQIAAGEGMGDLPYFRAPLYYYLLAFLYTTVGPSVVLARVCGCAMGAASCYLLGRLGVVLGGFRTGFMAAIIAAVYWPFIYFDGELLTVGLEIFLDIAFLLLLEIAVRRSGWRLFVVAGCVWGLSALTRPNVLAFAPVVVFWLWLLAPKNGRARFVLQRAGMIGAGTAMMILPVTIRNYIVGKEFVLIATNGGVNFYIGNNPRSDGVSAVVPGTRKSWWGGYDDTHRIVDREMGRRASEGEVSDFWYGKAVEWMRSDPLAWVKHTFHKLRLFWSPVEIPNNLSIWHSARLSQISFLFLVGFPVVACLGASGAVSVRREWVKWFLPASFLLTYMATVVAFFCNARYRLPVAPVLILFTAGGIDRIARMRSFAAAAAYTGWAACFALLLADNPPERSHFRINDEAKWNLTLGVHYGNPARQSEDNRRKAIEYLNRAVELTPQHPESLIYLGRALLAANRGSEAIKRFAEAVKYNPEHAEARLSYAIGLTLTSQYRRAENQCRAALKLSPSYAEAHAQLGYVLGKLHRKSEAIRHLRKALDINPKLAQAQAYLDEITE